MTGSTVVRTTATCGRTCLHERLDLAGMVHADLEDAEPCRRRKPGKGEPARPMIVERGGREMDLAFRRQRCGRASPWCRSSDASGDRGHPPPLRARAARPRSASAPSTSSTTTSEPLILPKPASRSLATTEHRRRQRAPGRRIVAVETIAFDRKERMPGANVRLRIEMPDIVSALCRAGRALVAARNASKVTAPLMPPPPPRG